MAVTLVQSDVDSSTSASSVSVAFSGASKPAAGNLLLVTGSIAAAAGTFTSCTDTQNTYETAVHDRGKGATLAGRHGMWYAKNVVEANTTITVALDQSSYIWMTASEWSGLGTSSPHIDDAAADNLDTSISAGSLTPTTANNVFLSLVECSGGAPTVASGYTSMHTLGHYYWEALEYKITTSTSSSDPSWTVAWGYNALVSICLQEDAVGGVAPTSIIYGPLVGPMGGPI